MVKYEPPPTDLSHLNPIQRYMQKGSLDREDYIRLGLLVAVYWILRPYIQKLFKKFFGGDDDVTEGEEIRDEYEQRRAKAALDANALRNSKGASQTIAESEKQDDVVASGSSAKEGGGTAVNRKKVNFAQPKTEEEKLLDWDDEPARRPLAGDSTDVVSWLDRWDENGDPIAT